MDRRIFFMLCLLMAKHSLIEALSTSGTFFMITDKGDTKSEKCISEPKSELAELEQGIFACGKLKDCNNVGKIKGKRKYEAVSLDADGNLSGYCSVLQKMQTTGNLPKVPKFKDCQEAYLGGIRKDGMINVAWKNGSTFNVFCNMTIDGGGWTVFQRRVDPSISFTRNWIEYVHGFGSFQGNFWLGLEALHQLTDHSHVQLRIDLKDNNGQWGYAKYDNFKINGAADEYRLQSASYQEGNIGDSMLFSVGMKFSTPDNDNDKSSNNCAERYQGSWWFNACFRASLNSLHYNTVPEPNDRLKKMSWYYWKSEMGTITYSEMKIRIL